MTPLPSDTVVLLRDFNPTDDGLLYELGELPALRHPLVKDLGEAVAQVIPIEAQVEPVLSRQLGKQPGPVFVSNLREGPKQTDKGESCFVGIPFLRFDPDQLCHLGAKRVLCGDATTLAESQTLVAASDVRV
jgi:hypothetical protein